MHYLTRVEIDTDRWPGKGSRSPLCDYHDWVESSFPWEIEEEIRTRKLWRVDHLKGKDYLLIVSIDKPDLNLLERHGIPGSAQTKKYDPFLNSIKAGEMYSFMATLNPTISRYCVPDQRGRVYTITSARKQLEFLQKRAEKNGFVLDKGNFRITKSESDILWKEGELPVSIKKVTYMGKLIVSDADVFRKTLVMGIGREKAYGCGMMTVVP